MKTVLSLLGALAIFGAQARTAGPIDYPGLGYPASCLAWPLYNETPAGPTSTGTTSLARVDRATNQPLGTETVTFTFWRVPCSNGKSALLMRVSRPEGVARTDAVQWPTTLYGLTAQQGTSTSMLRVAQVPNAPEASLPPGALIPAASTFALENWYRTDALTNGVVIFGATQSVVAPMVDFNAALEVTLPSSGSSSAPTKVSIPAYDATLYPSASTGLPITGYTAGSYFDPAHSGEGMFVGVTPDYGSDFMLAKRSITVAWFTYDQQGRSFWLYGNLEFDPGARQLSVPMRYFTSGGFAGGGSAVGTAWGTLTLSFPDCQTMRFGYTANAGLPSPVPSGTGNKTWTRLTGENGLKCT